MSRPPNGKGYSWIRVINSGITFLAQKTRRDTDFSFTPAAAPNFVDVDNYSPGRVGTLTKGQERTLCSRGAASVLNTRYSRDILN